MAVSYTRKRGSFGASLRSNSQRTALNLGKDYRAHSSFDRADSRRKRIAYLATESKIPALGKRGEFAIGMRADFRSPAIISLRRALKTFEHFPKKRESPRNRNNTTASADELAP